MDDVIVGNACIGVAAFLNRDHVVAVRSKFLHDQEWKILIGINACHY